jgi:hypothetical protein
MAEPKTRPTRLGTRGWLRAIPDAVRRRECAALMEMMKSATGGSPELWGTSIVGFGRYPTTYESGKTLDWPLVAFASRGTGLVPYIRPGFSRYAALLKKLGPHRIGRSCLYVKRLADLDLRTLQATVEGSVAVIRAQSRAT